MRVVKPDGLPLRAFEYRSPRHRAEFAFWVQVEGAKEFIPARARNISCRGLGAFVERPIVLGAFVTAIIPCGAGNTARLRARVACGTGLARGLEFLRSSEAECKQIDYAISLLTGSKALGPAPGRKLGALTP